MMKRFISLAAAVLMCFAVLPMLVFSASAEENLAQGFDGDSTKSGIFDTAEMFSDEELGELTDLIQDYSDKLQMNIFIYLSGYRLSDSDTEIFADDQYDELFGEDTDGVFYYMDFSGKSPAYDYISTSGKAVLTYQDHIEDIFSSMDSYLPPSGHGSYEPYKYDIFNGIEHFLSLLESYFKSTRSNPLAYYHDTSSDKYFYFKNGEYVVSTKKPLAVRLAILAGSAAVGAIVAFIVYLVAKSRYKFKASTNPDVYISSEQTHFLKKEDTFIRTRTTRHRIESSSSGGSSGGGHSHSGGHGGGGHHR